ncbi:MAG: hypothetical protein LHV68_12110 [Elusimicrobia bacterium]|nr:hypothetical protein [Candidatus Liberimonas magnetica]
MVNRIIPIILFFLLIFKCYSAAEIIYLKNGDIINGSIVDQDSTSISVRINDKTKKIPRKEIKDIKTYEDIRSETDIHRDVMLDLDEKIGQDTIEIMIGPKFGFYNFKDTAVSKYHKNGLLLGINVGLWLEKHHGPVFEIESYNNTYNGSTLVYDTSASVSKISSYSEQISLMPFWLSYLYMFEKTRFFLGAGMGVVMTNKTITVGSAQIASKGDFTSYQLLTGFMNKKIGLKFKYSVIDTNEFWGNVNYGGYSLLLDLFF